MKFHERFEIAVDSVEAQRRFVNRALNKIFGETLSAMDGAKSERVRRRIAYELGVPYQNIPIEAYIINDFVRCLQAIEGLYKSENHLLVQRLDKAITALLEDSEVDLAIRWEAGRFVRKGAKLLDDRLVNDQLKWLSDAKYETVLAPFSKGLQHFVQSHQRPELLSDVVTDMYEALEALAKSVTGRDSKDLSANSELLIKKAGVSEDYKPLLKSYIAYANRFRHATVENRARPSYAEVEAFVYLTGLFVRLVAQSDSTLSIREGVPAAQALEGHH